MSQLQDDLKLIVGIKDLQDQIDLLANKLPIPAQVGLALQQDILNTSSSSSQHDYNSNSKNNGIGGIYGHGGIGTNATDGGALIDGTEPAVPGDKLNGMDNIFDCDTGKEILVREDGKAIPPPGWLTANTPPEGSGADFDVFPGFYFTAVSGTDFIRTINYMEAVNYAIDNTPVAGTFISWGASGPPNPADLPIVGSNANKNYPFNVTRNDDPSILQLSISMNRCDATTPPPDVADMCEASHEVTPTKWPSADNFQLIRGSDGILRPSELDPNVPSNFEDGVSTLDFCYGDGKHGRQESTVSGGFIIGETDGAGTDFIGPVKVFGADGTMQRNDVKPEDAALYRPKN